MLDGIVKARVNVTEEHACAVSRLLLGDFVFNGALALGVGSSFVNYLYILALVAREVAVDESEHALDIHGSVEVDLRV